jgi:Ca2+-binding EF-hand superfamily protein
MLGLEAQRRLKNFFTAVADGERDLEAARCRLCSIPDFAPRSAFSRVDRDCSGTVSNLEICQFLRDNGIHHVSESEAYNLVVYFDGDGNARLSFDEWVQMNLPCEDNFLRDRSMARIGPSIMRHEGLPRDIELAMCDVIEKEIAMQRNLETLKMDLAGCLEYNSSSAFATVDVLRQGVLTTINVSDFMRSQGIVLSELELVAIIRRMDTDGNCAITLGEFAEFVRPLIGVKPAYASPSRTVTTRYSSPVRVRTSTMLLESPVALSRSLSVERRVPLVSSVLPYSRYWDLGLPEYKYRYLDYPYTRPLAYSRYPYVAPVSYVAPSPYRYSAYYSPYSLSPYSPYVPARSYYSTALGRYVAV